MWEKEILKANLEKLMFIKYAKGGIRHVEFWCTGYIDSMFTRFEDESIEIREELADILLDTAIKYLENKLK